MSKISVEIGAYT